jgi:hypothetical protein
MKTRSQLFRWVVASCTVLPPPGPLLIKAVGARRTPAAPGAWGKVFCASTSRDAACQRLVQLVELSSTRPAHTTCLDGCVRALVPVHCPCWLFGSSVLQHPLIQPPPTLGISNLPALPTYPGRFPPVRSTRPRRRNLQWWNSRQRRSLPAASHLHVQHHREHPGQRRWDCAIQLQPRVPPAASILPRVQGLPLGPIRQLLECSGG